MMCGTVTPVGMCALTSSCALQAPLQPVVGSTQDADFSFAVHDWSYREKGCQEATCSFQDGFAPMAPPASPERPSTSDAVNISFNTWALQVRV